MFCNTIPHHGFCNHAFYARPPITTSQARGIYDECRDECSKLTRPGGTRRVPPTIVAWTTAVSNSLALVQELPAPPLLHPPNIQPRSVISDPVFPILSQGFALPFYNSIVANLGSDNPEKSLYTTRPQTRAHANHALQR